MTKTTLKNKLAKLGYSFEFYDGNNNPTLILPSGDKIVVNAFSVLYAGYAEHKEAFDICLKYISEL